MEILTMLEMDQVAGGGYHEEKGPVIVLPPAPTPDGTLSDI
jgi:hypothetical protein